MDELKIQIYHCSSILYELGFNPCLRLKCKYLGLHWVVKMEVLACLIVDWLSLSRCYPERLASLRLIWSYRPFRCRCCWGFRRRMFSGIQSHSYWRLIWWFILENDCFYSPNSSCPHHVWSFFYLHWTWVYCRHEIVKKVVIFQYLWFPSATS